MTAEYRVPKREVKAEAWVFGLPRVVLRFFLGQRDTFNAEYERLSDLLNKPAPFVPAVDDTGAAYFLRREAILSLSLPVRDEIDDDHPLAHNGREDVTRMEVEIAFESGGRLRGTLAFCQPEARRRLGDFLSDSDRFFALRDGEIVHLVNKDRIARAQVLSAGR